MPRIFLLFLISLLSVSNTFAGDSAHVELFSPQGIVKNVRQVTARFSGPMVSFGEPRLSDPFEIDCPEQGKGRWIDGRTWSFDFARNLPAGVVCRFRLRPGLKALSGEEVTGEKSFSFSTGGPAVISSLPRKGNRGIDEQQAFVLSLDAEAVPDSVISHSYCAVEGIEERIGLRIIEGDERSQILKALDDRLHPPWRRQEKAEREEHLLVLQCRQAFPSKAAVKLVWGKGVRSESGVETLKDQVLSFRTRSPFSVRFSCMREKAGADCIPLTPMVISFSEALPWKTAQRIELKDAEGRIWRPKKEGDEQDPDSEVWRVVINGPFPELSSFTLSLPPELRDDSGRQLSNSDEFPMTVQTDSYPPLARFAARFGIIEAGEGAALPVTVRNLEADVRIWLREVDGKDGSVLEQDAAPVLPGAGKDSRLTTRLRAVPTDQETEIIRWLKILASAERKSPMLRGKEGNQLLSLPMPEGPKAFEVVGIPLKKPGFYLAEIESSALGSRLLGSKAVMYVPAGALITNMAAHFKRGEESSLVWVTSLDKGAPVPGAEITLRDCTGKEAWKGRTDGSGLAHIRTSLPSDAELPYCEGGINYAESQPGLGGVRGGLFVFARTKNDLTFTHSSWDEGIEPWRFHLPRSYGNPEGATAHTILDRSLLRAGELVHMKHVMRKRTMTGFSLLASADLPDEAVLEHMGSEEQYTFPLSWSAQGTAETAWRIPEGAKLGTYRISLIRKGKARGTTIQSEERSWASGSFRVEEFRVPLMKAVIQPPKESLIRPVSLELDLAVSYLSGGGASGLPVRLRSELQPKGVILSGYEGFTFSNGAVREGVEDSSKREGGEEQDGRLRLKTMDLSLDKAGTARVTLNDLPEVTEPKELLTELEFRDPNGEVRTASARIPLYPSPWLIGLKPAAWAASRGTVRYTVAVTDLTGAPAKSAEVSVRLLQVKNYTHRRRITGGFYAYEYIREVKGLGEHCRGRTNEKGLLFCEGGSPVSGSVVLLAETKDPEGNTAAVNREVWVAGGEDWWFEMGNDDRIDLIPEKKRYEPGETARFQVRMPFKETTALVTVEREGIMDSFVTKISRNNPVVELPVKGNYAPNCFVSVLAVRGRMPGKKPTALFDPGKPAYKLGIGEISVGWKAHELKVQVRPEKDVYKVRERAKVRIEARTAFGTPPPKGTEVAVAAVDEGLLELMPNESWKLLEGMMSMRGYSVTTATAQMMVVGKRHFGKKALPPGGGGGRRITRELFDTLLFWKGRVVLDEKGEASVEIPLNDSITSLRIVAVALSGPGFFGTGEASIRTTQELMLLSGLPPLVREGDRFRAGFTVRNTTKRAMTVDLSMGVRGVTVQHTAETIPAGEAREVGWDITVPYKVSSLIYDLWAQEQNGTAGDSLRKSQKVLPSVPVRTFQATLLQVKDKVTIPVERPSEAIPGSGGIALSLKPQLAAGLTGVAGYMQDYPYTCMEQKTSRSVALRDREVWNKVVAELPAHMDGEGLVKYFPLMEEGSDVLTSYILAITNEAGYAIPEGLMSRMLEGLKGFVAGKVQRRSFLSMADLSLRRLSGIEALSRYGEADAAMVSSVAIEPNLWPASALLDWIQILARLPDLPERDKKIKEAETVLRSRMNLQGTTMNLSTERTDNLWWLMTTPDTNAVKTLLVLLPRQDWQEDIPRIARGLTGRMRKGHWDTTTANAWGVLAMERFSKAFESAPVAGKTAVSLGAQADTLDWGREKEGGELSLGWPEKKTDLAVVQKGTGAPWATVQSRAAIPLKKPFSSGFSITKTIIPVEQRVKGRWSKGDLVRVRLELSAQSDMTWVALTDPIPAGAAILGGGLQRSSLLTEGERQEGWVREAFRERSFEAFRTYYAFVPRGGWSMEYTMRLNNEGRFHLPPTRVEALYAPEMFGELPNRDMEVLP